jgi:hypothetical protein
MKTLAVLNRQKARRIIALLAHYPPLRMRIAMYRPSMRKICLVFSLICTPCLADEFCGDLKAVIQASEKLSDLKGKQKRENFWEAKNSVSGFRPCEILHLPDGSVIFSCGFPSRKSFSSAKNDFERVEKAIVSCLPPAEWSHQSWAEKSFGQPQDIGHSFTRTVDGSSGLLSIGDGTDDTPKMSQYFYLSLAIYERKK